MFFKARKRHRRVGDAHRALAEWNLAALAYRRHLDERPDDAAIWVQLGHMEKEDGRIEEAGQAYRRAAELDPQDPDPLLHLSHMLKRHGQHGEAFETFRRLFRLDPGDNTIHELQAAARRQPSRVMTSKAGSAIFPLEDFFGSFEAFATFTGIQRVQAGAILAAMDDPALDAHFVLNDDRGASAAFARIDDASLRAVVDYARGESVDHAALRRMLAEARLTAVPLTIGAGSWIVILGAFWGLENRIDRFLKAVRHGARLVLYIHDIIPITHAEYCEAHLSNAFWRALAEYLQVVDHVMTNSDYTGQELARFIAENGGRPVPMRTVPLAHSIGVVANRNPVWPAALSRVKKGRYAAYVSTIEGRKNHLFVVQAWERLIAEGVDVPDLVFVGRKGWKIEPLTDLLARTNNLGGRVHIVSDLSDGELDAVYSNAMFTVFTSLAEGWGLPVGESLSHGVPCVASRSSSLPEVGGDFADYVDPSDLDGAVGVLRRMIGDGGYRAGRRNAIREGFVPRTWGDVGHDIVDKLKALIEAPPERHAMPVMRLRAATTFRPGAFMTSATPVGEYVANPAGLALAGSFYEAERSGAWMRGISGELTFGTDVEPGTAIVVMLALNAAPWAAGHDCFVSIGSAYGQPRALKLQQGRNLIRLTGPVAADGTCTVVIAYEGVAPKLSGDTRSFVVALNAVGYCRADDAAGRADVREELAFS